jgi:transposase-like protein
MEERRTRKRYDRQFKVDAVRMITEGCHNLASVSRELGVGRSQLQRRWNARRGHPPNG